MVSVLLNCNSLLECCFDTFFSVVSLVTVKRTAPYVHAVIITLAFWVTIAIVSFILIYFHEPVAENKFSDLPSFTF